jgi:single-stranded-DNA-specific exonuclease
MPKRWNIRPHDPDRIAALERAAGVPAVVAQLLLCRGIQQPQLVRQFLDAPLKDLRDPDALPGAREAARRIWAAAREKKRIVIHGDYDVDGITGTSILVLCLRLLGANVGYFIPDRLSEGYGLHEGTVRRLAGEGAALIVTVDCGITGLAAARTARDLGIGLIVTDHHQMQAELPCADVLVHPRLAQFGIRNAECGIPNLADPSRQCATGSASADSPPDMNSQDHWQSQWHNSPSPFADLCGSAVAFKLAWAICQEAAGARRASPPMRDFLLQAVVLAALGTVADVVPLVDENRILVRHGLVGLKERPLLGLRVLMQVSQLDQKRRLSAEDIGFGLAPRLNAAGRLGQARLAVELLTTDSEPRALELAQYIEGLNATRKHLERSIYLAAKKQAREAFDPEADAALVLAARGWHAGVIGIVAGRLAEKFHRPVVLLSQDELATKPAIGSGRSVAGFDLCAALGACSHHLLSHGGHAAAAGLKIEDRSIDPFRAEFCEHAAAVIPPEMRSAELHIDAETPLTALTLNAVRQIEQLAPFGSGNARPLLCTEGVRLVAPPKRMGDGERHLLLNLVQHNLRLRAVAFGGGEWADELSKHVNNGPLSIAFRPVINVFGGRQSVELELADWKT